MGPSKRSVNDRVIMITACNSEYVRCYNLYFFDCSQTWDSHLLICEWKVLQIWKLYATINIFVFSFNCSWHVSDLSSLGGMYKYAVHESDTDQLKLYVVHTSQVHSFSPHLHIWKIGPKCINGLKQSHTEVHGGYAGCVSLSDRWQLFVHQF